MHKCKKTQSRLIVRLELKEKSGGINRRPLVLGLLKGFCVGSIDWCDYGSRNQAASCGYGCKVLPLSYLDSQSGDQMDARDWEMQYVS